MRDSTRLLATIVIWGAFTIVVGIMGSILIAVHGHIDWTSGAALFMLAWLLMKLVRISTQTVWGVDPEAKEDEPTRSAKAKRIGSRRVERLIESLDDDEIYDLETLLLSREDSAAPHKDS
jgi:hypothetical protein